MIPTDREAELVAIARTLTRVAETLTRIVDRLLGERRPRRAVTIEVTIGKPERDPDA